MPELRPDFQRGVRQDVQIRGVEEEFDIFMGGAVGGGQGMGLRQHGQDPFLHFRFPHAADVKELGVTAFFRPFHDQRQHIFFKHGL